MKYACMLMAEHDADYAQATGTGNTEEEAYAAAMALIMAEIGEDEGMRAAIEEDITHGNIWPVYGCIQ